MENEMVHRVAKDMEYYAFEHPNGWNVSDGDNRLWVEWTTKADAIASAKELNARAAIMAMRLPTFDMQSKGAEANDKYATEVVPCSASRAVDAWKAMIDEALK